jgi:hypothetical protein
VDSLAGQLYNGKNRPLVKAWIKAVSTVVEKPRTEVLPGVDWSVVGPQVEEVFGGWLAKGMEKKHAWLASELVRIVQEG